MESDGQNLPAIAPTEKSKQIARLIVARTNDDERQLVVEWLNGLLSVSRSDAGRLTKAKQALALTSSRRVIWPVVRMLSAELKRHAWDDRKTATRFAAVGAI